MNHHSANIISNASLMKTRLIRETVKLYADNAEVICDRISVGVSIRSRRKILY